LGGRRDGGRCWGDRRRRKSDSRCDRHARRCRQGSRCSLSGGHNGFLLCRRRAACLPPLILPALALALVVVVVIVVDVLGEHAVARTTPAAPAWEPRTEHWGREGRGRCNGRARGGEHCRPGCGCGRVDGRMRVGRGMERERVREGRREGEGRRRSTAVVAGSRDGELLPPLCQRGCKGIPRRGRRRTSWRRVLARGRRWRRWRWRRGRGSGGSGKREGEGRASRGGGGHRYGQRCRRRLKRVLPSRGRPQCRCRHVSPLHHHHLVVLVAVAVVVSLLQHCCRRSSTSAPRLRCRKPRLDWGQHLAAGSGGAHKRLERAQHRCRGGGCSGASPSSLQQRLRPHRRHAPGPAPKRRARA
jgi:hypothetical protein